MASDNYDIFPPAPELEEATAAAAGDIGKETAELVSLVKQDLGDQTEWRGNQVKWRDHRRCKIKDKPATPGGATTVIDVIDENLSGAKEQMVSVFDGARRIMSFMPLDGQADQAKAIAETIFDSILRFDLKFRQKNEIGIDRFLERGMCLFHDRMSKVRGRPLPVMEIVDPLEVVIPVECRDLSEADRICRIHRYTERQFKEEAKTRGWENADRIWLQGSKKSTGESAGEDGVAVFWW